MANNAGTRLMFTRLNWIRTAGTYQATLSNVYVALWTAAPFANYNSGGTSGTEVTGGSYARVAIPSSGWSALSGASPTQISNTAPVTFPTATADWGTIVAISLMDASTVGNLLELYPLGVQTRAVFNGDTLSFDAGNLVIQSGGVGTYLQNARLNWWKGTTHPAAPSTVYIALFTTAPALDGTGGVEVSGGSYARVAVPQGSASWNAQTGGGTTGTPEQVSNNAAITFPQATADWGTVVAAGVYDASTSGNLLYLGTLSSSRQVLNGDTYSYANGTFVLQED